MAAGNLQPKHQGSIILHSYAMKPDTWGLQIRTAQQQVLHKCGMTMPAKAPIVARINTASCTWPLEVGRSGCRIILAENVTAIHAVPKPCQQQQ
jgi:hypothetical protein